MKTQAYFENIKEVIIKEIETAKYTIHIAVAWFTDKELFLKLLEKKEKGVIIYLIILDDDINNERGPDFEKLNGNNCRLFRINNMQGEHIMHNKFCIIDKLTIINGSYNWSYKARSNHENITVIKEDSELADQFINEFECIVSKYFSEDSFKKQGYDDIANVIKRLELIKTLITLNEWEEIPKQINKISSSITHYGLENIIDNLKNELFSDAIEDIELFLIKSRQLTTYIDPEIETLKLEIRAIEIQISSVNNEKIEIEKLIFDFSIIQNQKIGHLIKRLLQLKTLLLEKNQNNNKEEYTKAKEEYEEFTKSFEELTKKKQFELTEDEKKQLKELYRQTSKLCHPDLVQDELKDTASEIFKELKNAYDENNLEKINELYNLLKNGDLFTFRSNKISEKEKRKVEVLKLRNILRTIILEIEKLKNTEIYKQIKVIIDWDIYFEEAKTNLIYEINELEQKI